MPSFEEVKAFIEKAGGVVESAGVVSSEGDAFVVASFPLPKSHWVFAEHENVPPMPFRCGTLSEERAVLEKQIKAAARYAVRVSTNNGKINDYDLDALVQNLVVGLVGYYTEDGLSSDPDAPTPQPSG